MNKKMFLLISLLLVGYYTQGSDDPFIRALNNLDFDQMKYCMNGGISESDKNNYKKAVQDKKNEFVCIMSSVAHYNYGRGGGGRGGSRHDPYGNNYSDRLQRYDEILQLLSDNNATQNKPGGIRLPSVLPKQKKTICDCCSCCLPKRFF